VHCTLAATLPDSDVQSPLHAPLSDFWWRRSPLGGPPRPALLARKSESTGIYRQSGCHGRPMRACATGTMMPDRDRAAAAVWVASVTTRAASACAPGGPASPTRTLRAIGGPRGRRRSTCQCRCQAPAATAEHATKGPPWWRRLMRTVARARNPRSPSPTPSPICPGMWMGVPSPICRGSGTIPTPIPDLPESGVHPHPRFPSDLPLPTCTFESRLPRVHKSLVFCVTLRQT
jgi:hypothetical protein